MLIDDLKAIQERFGYLPAEELAEYSERANVPLYRIEAVASFYPFFRRAARPATDVRVCRDLSCHLAGGAALYHRLKEQAAERGGEVEVGTCSCLGLCDQAPALLWNDHPVSIADCGLRIADWGPGGPDIPEPETQNPTPIGFSIDPYDGADRYQALRAVREGLAGEEVIAALKESGLRGMGGAGFPTGTKWGLVRGAAGAPKYVVCNADESEPGTFKDRALMETAPHLVLEGMLIAGQVIGAAELIVYLRHEYEAAGEALAAELERARAAGVLEGSPPVRVFVSPGGYICGEETALLEALEGKRAEPRNKPPFPGTHGLFGRPTVINNVETFALVPAILLRGAAWYQGIGWNGGVGPKLLALSGDVERAGVYQVPLGLTIGEFIEEHGGGVAGGRALEAVMPGGPSSGFLPPSMLETPLEFRALAQVGSMLGSGAVVVLDERRCMLDAALNVVRFFRNESCGKCVPCRAGSQQLVEILERWQLRQGKPADVPLVDELARAMADASICGLGQVAPLPITSALKYWPEEILAHVEAALSGRGVLIIEDCAVVLLAGGRSSRMGQPKAWLDFGGEPLLARIHARLAPHFSEFVVVSAPGQELPAVPAAVVHDEQPGEGPVGGLLAGLGAITWPLALALSCDVPFVSPAVAAFLVDAAAGFDVVVPEWGGRLHPLQAAYRATTRPVLAELFAAGRRRPVDLYDRVPTRTVREEELRALDPEGLSFLNLNTPEDYETALRRLVR